MVFHVAVPLQDLIAQLRDSPLIPIVILFAMMILLMALKLPLSYPSQCIANENFSLTALCLAAVVADPQVEV